MKPYNRKGYNSILRHNHEISQLNEKIKLKVVSLTELLQGDSKHSILDVVFFFFKTFTLSAAMLLLPDGQPH